MQQAMVIFLSLPQVYTHITQDIRGEVTLVDKAV